MDGDNSWNNTFNDESLAWVYGYTPMFYLMGQVNYNEHNVYDFSAWC